MKNIDRFNEFLDNGHYTEYNICVSTKTFSYKPHHVVSSISTSWECWDEREWINFDDEFQIYLEFDKANFEYYDNGCKIYNDWVTIEINIDRVY